MRRLVLLRHGLTPWNAEGRFQGHMDVELHPDGHRQARRAALALASYEPVTLWSSDLMRASQTAEYVAETTQLVPMLDERLREIRVGTLEGASRDEALSRLGSIPFDYGSVGGETDAEVGERVADAIAEFTASLGEGETGLAVSHGHAIRSGVATFLDWEPVARASLAGLDNCGWVELTDHAGRWRLAAYNRVTPIS